MAELEDYQHFRAALKGMASDFDALKTQICHEFKWSEADFEKTSLDFIIKCIIYIEEKRKKTKQ